MSQIACTLCPGKPEEKNRATVGLVCKGCHKWIDGQLREIDELYAELRHLLMPGGTGDSGGSQGKRSSGPLPLRVDVLNLLGPDSEVHMFGRLSLDSMGDWECQVGARPTMPLLQQWLRLVWQERGFTSDIPRNMPELIKRLRGQLEWICGREWVEGFADEVDRLALRPLKTVVAHDEPGAVQIGRCPDCGDRLYASVYSVKIRCDCGAEWPKTRWLLLGATQGDVEDASGVVRCANDEVAS